VKAGADEYVIKPFDPVDLLRMVDEALARTAERRRGLTARRPANSWRAHKHVARTRGGEGFHGS
jgi:DNA-binding response OmpR family regulator